LFPPVLLNFSPSTREFLSFPRNLKGGRRTTPLFPAFIRKVDLPTCVVRAFFLFAPPPPPFLIAGDPSLPCDTKHHSPILLAPSHPLHVFFVERVTRSRSLQCPRLFPLRCSSRDCPVEKFVFFRTSLKAASQGDHNPPFCRRPLGKEEISYPFFFGAL